MELSELEINKLSVTIVKYQKKEKEYRVAKRPQKIPVKTAYKPRLVWLA